MHITLWACLLFPPHRGHPQGEAPAQISSSVRRRLPPRTHTLEHSTLLLPRHLHSQWFNPAPPTLWHHRIPHLSLNAWNVRYLKLGCSKLGYTTTTMTTTQWSSTGQRLEGFWSGYGIREQLNWGTKGLGMWKGRMCRCLADWQIHNQPHAVKFCYSYWFCFCFLVCVCVKWSSWLRKWLGKVWKIVWEGCQLHMSAFCLWKVYSCPHLILIVLTDWLLSNPNFTFNKQINARLDKSFLSYDFLHKGWKRTESQHICRGGGSKMFFFFFCFIVCLSFRPILFVKQMGVRVALVGSM